MGTVVPDAWIVELEEPADSKVAYAEARWGGTWDVQTFGHVALMTHADD